MFTREPNLLIVSDLHLGLEAHVHRADGFARWLDAKTEAAVGGRPWRLLLAGDIFEFLFLAPDADGPERDLPPHVEQACRKLADMAPHMERALAAMARFAEAGHELHFMVGNHDRELMLRPVGELLERMITNRIADPAARSHARRRISIIPWFYREEGQLHVEHGNQFDEYSSYSEVMDPSPPGVVGALSEDRTLAVEEPVSHLGARLFMYPTNNIIDPEETEHWSIVDAARFMWEYGIFRTLGLFAKYCMMVRQTMRYSMRVKRASNAPTRRAIRAMKAQAKRFGVDPQLLFNLREYWHRPAGPLGVMRCFLADQIALVFATVLAVGTCLTGCAGDVDNTVALPSTLLVAGGAWLALSRSRSIEQHPRLVRAARIVSQVMSVPVVVFGHSHVPAHLRVADGKALYLNPGGWTDESETVPGEIALLRQPDGSLALRDEVSRLH